MLGDIFFRETFFFTLRILTLEQKSASGPVHPLRKTGSFTLTLEGRIADALVVQKYGSFLERCTCELQQACFLILFWKIQVFQEVFHHSTRITHIVYLVEKRNMYIHHCSNW